MLTYIIFFFFIIVTLSESKECHGTSDKMGQLTHTTKDRYQVYREMYKGCTKINTNLEITHLVKEGTIDFLDDIQEIKGYMMFVGNKYPSNFSLPNLRIVRGNYLWRNSSFSIVHNNNLTNVLFPALTEISTGKLWISKNDKLCHVDTINWSELMYGGGSGGGGGGGGGGSGGGGSVDVQTISNKCEECSEECSYDGHVSCWSPSVCQKFDKSQCERECVTGCPKEEPRYCCDSQCIGGCSGISPTQCSECRNFQDGDTCVKTCPDLFTYNHVTMMEEPNPHGKYSYMNLCVTKCPTSTVIHNGHCLQSCPQGYEGGGNRTCKPCDKEKGCPKTCLIPNKSFQQKHHNLFINCTLIRGNLKIFNYTIASEDPSHLEYLSKLQEITGLLIIQGEHPEFKNLNFLRNLKVIRGQRTIENKRNKAITISATTLEDITLESLENIEDNGLSITHNNHLKNLNFPKLKSIKRPKEGLTIEIKVNKKLCYLSDDSFEGIALGDFNITLNRNSTECEEEGLVCDDECRYGCWGGGHDRCTACKHYTYEGQCIATCNKYPELFRVNDDECVRCHEECDGGCHGYGADECKECRHAKDASTCVSECPPMKYLQPTTGQCISCAKECKHGCDGDNGKMGEGGCFSCHLLMKDTGRCIAVESMVCNDSYYRMHDKMKVQLSQKNYTFETVEVCAPCHNLCTTCHTGGSTPDVCTCKYAQYEGSCVKTCPSKHFQRHDDVICVPCHEECEICHGSHDYQCSVCENARLYHADITNKTNEEEEDGGYDDDDVDDGRLSYGSYQKDDDDVEMRMRRRRRRRSHTQQPITTHLNTDNFTCVNTCPDYLPYGEEEEEDDDDGDGGDVDGGGGGGGGIRKYMVCTANMPMMSTTGPPKKEIFVLIGAFVMALVLVAVVVAFVVRKRQREKMMTIRFNAEMHGINTQEVISPSNTKPDLSCLRLIKEGELKRDREIGAGAFGTVFRGVWSPESEKVKVVVAIKVLIQGSTISQQNELLEEARVMASVIHPCCIRIMAVCMSRDLMLITPLLQHGALLDYIKKPNDIASHTMLNWAAQIARGMNYLESKGIVHRDLAARNILVRSQSQVVITDFGLAKLLNTSEHYLASDGKLPIKWLALESIQHRIFTHKSDVWSFGVTLWELFTRGLKPYANIKAQELGEYLENGERLPQPSICTIDVYMLMIKCWLVYVDNRPTFDDLEKELSTMSKDPGRFLVIEGDKHNTTFSSSSLNTEPFNTQLSLCSSDDGQFMSADDYLDADGMYRMDMMDGKDGMDGMDGGRIGSKKFKNQLDLVNEEVDYENSHAAKNDYANQTSNLRNLNSALMNQSKERKTSVRYQKTPGKIVKKDQTNEPPRPPSMDEKKLMKLEQLHKQEAESKYKNLNDSQDYLLSSATKADSYLHVEGPVSVVNPEYLSMNNNKTNNNNINKTENNNINNNNNKTEYNNIC